MLTTLLSELRRRVLRRVDSLRSDRATDLVESRVMRAFPRSNGSEMIGVKRRLSVILVHASFPGRASLEVDLAAIMSHSTTTPRPAIVVVLIDSRGVVPGRQKFA